MSLPPETGEISALFPPPADVPSDEQWRELWARHDQYPAGPER